MTDVFQSLPPSNLAQWALVWSQVAPGPERQGVHLSLPDIEALGCKPMSDCCSVLGSKPLIPRGCGDRGLSIGPRTVWQRWTIKQWSMQGSIFGQCSLFSRFGTSTFSFGKIAPRQFIISLLWRVETSPSSVCICNFWHFLNPRASPLPNALKRAKTSPAKGRLKKEERFYPEVVEWSTNCREEVDIFALKTSAHLLW